MDTHIASIVQNARPNVILAPLQLGLGKQLHRQFGSRFLVDSLYSHCLCLSYDEVFRYERCAEAYQGTNIPDLEEHPDSYSIQAVSEKVDYNAKL